MIAAPLLLALPLAAAQDADSGASRVRDNGSLLTPAQEQSLHDLLESFTQGRVEELAVLTVPSLDGQSIEVTPRRVAREWQAGSGDHRNTALLVIARDEELMRWAVGRALRDRLTDEACGRILREVVAPELEGARYYEGLRAGLEAAHAILGGDTGPLDGNPLHRGARGSLLGTLLFAGLVAVGVSRAARRGRSEAAGALSFVSSTGVGREVGHRTEAGRGSFRRFGGGGGFAGGGATGGWHWGGWP